MPLADCFFFNVRREMSAVLTRVVPSSLTHATVSEIFGVVVGENLVVSPHTACLYQAIHAFYDSCGVTYAHWSAAFRKLNGHSPTRLALKSHVFKDAAKTHVQIFQLACENGEIPIALDDMRDWQKLQRVYTVAVEPTFPGAKPIGVPVILEHLSHVGVIKVTPVQTKCCDNAPCRSPVVSPKRCVPEDVISDDVDYLMADPVMVNGAETAHVPTAVGRRALGEYGKRRKK